MVTVISLGGSIIAPQWPDRNIITRFRSLIEEHLLSNESHRFVLVVGGGGIAREYQQACRELLEDPSNEDQDWVGIMATRLNAELVRIAFSKYCQEAVVSDPGSSFNFTGRILVAAGWKPGFSTDYDAVLLAERFATRQIINISNIEHVYNDDPRINSDAQPLKHMRWQDYLLMVGEQWTPGRNLPFDPIAARQAAKLGIEVIVIGGNNMKNIARVLRGESFFGSRISD